VSVFKYIEVNSETSTCVEQTQLPVCSFTCQYLAVMWNPMEWNISCNETRYQHSHSQ